MADIDTYFDQIDSSRSRRARELSNAKESFDRLATCGQTIIAGKAIIVLAYANWEGFYNECVDSIVNYFVACDLEITEICWAGLTGAFLADFARIRDRNHSTKSLKEFVGMIETGISNKFCQFDRKIAQAQSNLNFERLVLGCSFLGIETTPFIRHRNKIDRELVGWRHSIAHGDTIDLTSLKADDHLNFASEMMLTVADSFQEAMVKAA